MLVYANHLSFRGAGAKDAVFKGIGGWLKEQLGFGLHPDQLRAPGEFDGTRGEGRSWLRILATAEEEPELYSWVLRCPDSDVRGRHWITEIGLKSARGTLELSCVVKTDEASTLVASPVMASQPRIIRYVVNNVMRAEHADFANFVAGVRPFTIGQDRDSYRGLLADIERVDRDSPIVLVSPTATGEYLVAVRDLQQKLVGLAQVVEIAPGFNSYEMADVLGRQRSAWGGAINILYAPSTSGALRSRHFLADAITGWGEMQPARVAQVLAWVTNNTNMRRMRKHVRPEGVMQLAMRRQMQAARSRSEHMDAEQLREALEAAEKQALGRDAYFDELVAENAGLGDTIADLRLKEAELGGEINKRDFTIAALKDQLSRAGEGRGTTADAADLLELACRIDDPSPAECLSAIAKVYGARCIVLDSAHASAEESLNFVYGRQLLEMLKRLVTTYRDTLMTGGDNEARKVFGRKDYAAKESETVMNNRAMRRQRTFVYDGETVEMFRHLKINIADDESRTIRVHFHWDAAKEKIVIGYCGAHLSVSSH